MKHRSRIQRKVHFVMWERTPHSRSQFRSKRSIEPPWDPLAARLRESLQTYQKTIYLLSAVTGIDGAYIWRMVRGERIEVSREVLLLISLALVLEKEEFERVVIAINGMLDAGGYKTLRIP